MTIRTILRSVEKVLIRPVGRTGRRILERLRGGRGDRVSRLERRVDDLESLVRELTGLAYLRLADEEAADGDRTAA
jgi:hypothetical protein